MCYHCCRTPNSNLPVPFCTWNPFPAVSVWAFAMSRAREIKAFALQSNFRLNAYVLGGSMYGRVTKALLPLNDAVALWSPERADAPATPEE
jgi:hypothetical protein